MDIDTEHGMAQAAQWLTGLLDMNSEQFTWGIPRSSAVYLIDKKRKTVTRTAGYDSSTERVFVHLGYTIFTSATQGDSGE